jgi:prepilin-type N-terminal cleavage/methylation domain-containing protein
MRGFTLLELLIAIAILGVLAAIPVAHDRSDAARLDAAALALVADLESAREEALVGGKSAGVAFATDGVSYAVHGDFEQAAETPPLWQRKLIAGRVIRWELRREGWLVFAGDGSVAAGGAIDLALGAERRRVRLHEASGTAWVTKP